MCSSESMTLKDKSTDCLSIQETALDSLATACQETNYSLPRDKPIKRPNMHSYLIKNCIQVHAQTFQILGLFTETSFGHCML